MRRDAYAWVYRDAAYLRARAALLATRPPCWECGQPARMADHDPPLSQHQHRRGAACCVLRPHCWRCSAAQGGRLKGRPANGNGETLLPPLEPAGFDADHPAWRLPWLEAFTDVPAEATWPRLMTAPHPAAVGSLGDDFVAFANERMGGELRWWQRLVATRILEVDADGRLVWTTAIVTCSRQCGKSTLLRELLLWRMLQAERFGEEQLVVHVAKDRAIAREVQRAARVWARERPEFTVTSANGYELIEHASGRWVIKSRGGVYGHSSSFVALDEAWAVATSELEDAIVPTMIERAQSQLLLVSTANRNATSLMLGRRRAALELLDDPGEGDLLLEWSASPDAEIGDPAAWRQASPHWSEQRERTVRAAVQRALSGDSDDDDDDPAASVKSQWLDQWVEPVRREESGRGERLLPDGVWESLRVSEDAVGSAAIALEDHYGQGGAVAICRRLSGDRFGLCGWQYPTRAEAVAEAERIAAVLPGSRLVAGATLVNDADVMALRIVRPAAGTGVLTRQGLALLRELAAQERVAWDADDGDELAGQLASARVVERQSGLVLVGGERSDLVRASVWALVVAAERKPAPAIH